MRCDKVVSPEAAKAYGYACNMYNACVAKLAFRKYHAMMCVHSDEPDNLVCNLSGFYLMLLLRKQAVIGPARKGA